MKKYAQKPKNYIFENHDLFYIDHKLCSPNFNHYLSFLIENFFIRNDRWWLKFGERKLCPDTLKLRFSQQYARKSILHDVFISHTLMRVLGQSEFQSLNCKSEGILSNLP